MRLKQYGLALLFIPVCVLLIMVISYELLFCFLIAITCPNIEAWILALLNIVSP